MAKKKKSSKNKRTTKKQLVAKHSTPERMGTVNRKESFQLVTPVKLFEVNKIKDESFFYTPVQKKCNTKRTDSGLTNGTINIKNFNALDYPAGEDEHVKKQSSKVYCPAVKEISMNSKMTHIDDNQLFNPNNLIETPKLSRATNAIRIQESAYLKGQEKNTVNINPYVKDNSEMGLQQSKWDKAQNLEEIPFFPSRLFQGNLSSTPIQQRKLLNHRNDSIANEQMDKSANEKLDLCEVDLTPLKTVMNNTPKPKQVLNKSILDNININTPPLVEKTMDKENSVWILGSEKKPTLKQRISPKLPFSLHRKNLSTFRKKSLSLDLSFSDKSRVADIGMYENIINKIKRYSSASRQWSGKILTVCSQLGMQIKNNLTSFYHQYDKSLPNNLSPECKCGTYKMEITTLKLRIDSISEELKDRKNKETQIDYVVDELKKVKQTLAELKDLPSEVKILQQRADKFRTASTTETIGSHKVTTAAIPPPPPPPPPPAPLFVNKVLPKIERSNSALTMRTKLNNEKTRPAISLEEILKVKLKKPSERSFNRSCSSSSTVIDDNIIKKVTLRPFRPTFRANTMPNVTSSPIHAEMNSAMPSSPASSLNKLLLQDNSPVRRLKRLKKAGRFSVDSIYRRTPTVSGMEERERVNN